MNQIRLLPIVVVAASALLGLKVVGLATGAGYTLGGPSAVIAQEADVGAEAEAAASDLAAADAAADALFDAVPDGTGAAGETELLEIDGSGAQTLVESDAGATGDALLERLAERRAELDAFAAELETRLAVVEAAEVRIEERMTELSAIEADINATVDAQDAAEAEQFAAVVAMYENMRPADAATIFNDLDTGVLVRVGKQMNPRKLGPIMAKMLPVRAQELTVLLAQTGTPDAEPAPQVSELPQIVGQ